jgi:hypothetical protein
MGHPGWDLWPIVIDPSHAPAAQGAGPYLILLLACLPALDMETPAGARQVLAAIRDTGASHAERRRLTAIILKRASDAARQTLEAMMSDVLKVMDARALRATPEQRAEVAAAAGIAQLDVWFDRALTADTAADVFDSPVGE